MATDVLMLLQTPGFEVNAEAHQLVQERIGAIHYQIDSEVIVALCRAALQNRMPSLCLLLSRFYHAESQIGLAAFFALLPDPVTINLSGTDLYSQEVLTAIIDFYIAYRSGLVAGSLASVRYTENSATGNFRQTSKTLGSFSVNCSAQGSSTLFGKPSLADLLPNGRGARAPNKTLDIFGANLSGSALLGDQAQTTMSESLCPSSAHVGKSVVGRSLKKSYDRRKVLTDDEFLQEYIIATNPGNYYDLCRVGNPDSLVFHELLHADMSKITAIIDAVIKSSGVHAKLSFLLQTQHLASTQTESRGTIDLSYLQIPTLQGTSEPTPQCHDDVKDEFILPNLQDLMNVTAAPFIQQLPTKTLKIIEEDAYLISDTVFRFSLLQMVGDEYKRRCLFENAAHCYTLTHKLESLAMLFLDVINLVPEAPFSSSGPNTEKYTVLLFHLIQLAFQVFRDLPNSMINQVLLLLKKEEIKTTFGATFLESLKTQILAGVYPTTLYSVFFKEKSSVRIDRNILHKVQHNIPKYSAEHFMIVSAYLMANLMQAQLGHSLQLSKTSLLDLSAWAKFERVSYDGIVFKGTVTSDNIEFYDRFYSAMQTGRLTPEIDGYTCGGMLFGLGIISSDIPAGNSFSPAKFLEAARNILSNPGDHIAIFDENGAPAPRPAVQGYEGFIFGYSIAVGLICLGTKDMEMTTRLAALLKSPGAFHPDAIYGLLIGLGLLHLGDPLFLKAFKFNDFYLSTFGMGMTTSATTITVTDNPPQLYVDVANKILSLLVSKHEKMRAGAAFCIALCCYCIETQANQAIEFLLDFEPRIQTSHLTSNSLCDGIQKAGVIALGLAYAHTNSLEVATQLVSIASRSTVDDVSYHGLIMIAFVLSSQHSFANELLILATKSHRVACRQGAALALGYINAGTWDPVVVNELRSLMSDQVEVVRNHAVIAQALVLQTCSAPTLPERIKIETDAPVGDRQKDVIYTQDHSSEFVKRVKALNKLRHVPGRIQDRAREFAAFEAAMVAKPEPILAEDSKKARKTKRQGQGDTSNKVAKSDTKTSAGVTQDIFSNKDDTDPTIARSREFAKVVQAQLERGFTLEDYCSQFRMDLLGLLTDYNFFDMLSTDLSLRACMIALGILNCGGMNSSFSILTPAGLPKTSATIGALLFAESYAWHPFAPCISMCLSPDVCITVIPSIDETGKIELEISEGLFLIEKAYTYPYPDLSVEKTVSSLDKYVKNAKLSLGTAKKHVNDLSSEAGEPSNFSYVKEVSKMATKRFLREAMDANLVDAILDDNSAKSDENQANLNEGLYSILQTPCRMLRRQVKHVIIPENSDLIPISGISQGVVVLYEWTVG